MKQIFKLLGVALFFATTFSACKKDENKIFYEGGKNPVLTVSSTAPLVLNINNKNLPAISFSWTNPDYKFTTGLSSQDVFYTLQVDTANVNFRSSKLQEVVISKDLSKMFTVGELNTLLASLGLVEFVTKTIDIRLKSNLVGGSAILYSNVIKLTVTPYLDVVYPVPTALFITGGATPLSWQCGCASDGTGSTQKFTKIGSTTFELNITLTGGQSYLFLPEYGSWSAKYGFDGNGNDNNVNGDLFRPGGNDIKAPAATKSYKITVEFKTGKFTVQ